MTHSVALATLNPTKLVELLGVNNVRKGEGDPTIQVRIGPPGRGVFMEKTIVELREIALNLGLSGTHAPDGYFDLPVGDGRIQGLGEELVELGAQMGEIAGTVELEVRPPDDFINLGSMA